MPINPDITTTPSSPSELNAYYIKAAPYVDMIWAKEATPDNRIYTKWYNPKVTSYDPAGKGVSRRQIQLEHRRSNQNFSVDWQAWKRGCGPQDWTERTVGRPGASETWSYLMHLQYKTPAFWLKQIVAESMNLPMQLQNDFRYLENVRRDIYNEYFRFFHLTFAGKHWMPWKDAAGKFHFDDKIGGGSYASPWRFANAADGCLNNVDRIYVSDDATNAISKVTAFTAPCARKLQQSWAGEVETADYDKITLITSDVAAEQVTRADDVLLDAIKRRQLGGDLDSVALFHKISQKTNLGDLMNFEVDRQIIRYRSTGTTNDQGEFILERVPQFLDVNTDSDLGVRTIQNPDWENPLVAAFEIYVVKGPSIYAPMRPNWPSTLGHGMEFPHKPFSQWNWYNVQNMEENRDNEWGFFAMQDDMMAQSLPEARMSSLVLVRRRPDDFELEDVADALVAPTYVNQTPQTECKDVQFKCTPPACAPTQDGFNYAYPQVSPSCPNCL